MSRRSSIVRYWWPVNHGTVCAMGHTIFAGERAMTIRRSSWESATLCEACALNLHGEKPPLPKAYQPAEPDAKTRALGESDRREDRRLNPRDPQTSRRA